MPGASHFAALDIANPSWRNAYQVATIGGHTLLQGRSPLILRRERIVRTASGAPFGRGAAMLSALLPVEAHA